MVNHIKYLFKKLISNKNEELKASNERLTLTNEALKTSYGELLNLHIQQKNENQQLIAKIDELKKEKESELSKLRDDIRNIATKRIHEYDRSKIFDVYASENPGQYTISLGICPDCSLEYSNINI